MNSKYSHFKDEIHFAHMPQSFVFLNVKYSVFINYDSFLHIYDNNIQCSV